MAKQAPEADSNVDNAGLPVGEKATKTREKDTSPAGQLLDLVREYRKAAKKATGGADEEAKRARLRELETEIGENLSNPAKFQELAKEKVKLDRALDRKIENSAGTREEAAQHLRQIIEMAQSQLSAIEDE